MYLNTQLQEIIDGVKCNCEIFHFTLDPQIDEIQKRIKNHQQGFKSLEELEQVNEQIRNTNIQYSFQIDNILLSPTQTWDKIIDCIKNGEGRINRNSM